MFKIQNLKIDPEIYENPLFSIHMKGIRICGFIIDKNQNYEFLHLARFYFLAFSMICACILNFLKMLHSLDKLDQYALCSATAFLYASTSVMLVNACFQRRRIVTLVTFLHYDLQNLLLHADANEKSYYQRTVRFLQNFTWFLFLPSIIAGAIMYLNSIYSTIFYPERVFNISKILDGTIEPVLLHKVFPFAEVNDTFIIGHICPYYAVVLAVVFIPIGHTFKICIMRYVIIKSHIINERMEKMDVRKVYKAKCHSDGEPSVKDLQYWRLQLCNYCIDEQNKIRWFVNELEALLRVPVFVDFIICSVLFCFIFYTLNNGSLSKLDYVFISIYLQVLLSILWMYHWHATLIAQCNDNLCFAIYSSEWYNYTPTLQHTLRLIMTNTIIPLQMRAIFIEMNLNTFINIINRAYGYYTILRNINTA